MTDTSESEEEEEAEDDDGDLTGGTGSALAASDSALESESDAEGAFWRRPGRVRVAGGPTPPPDGDRSSWSGTGKPGSDRHPSGPPPPLWVQETHRHADTHGYVHTQPTLTHRHTLVHVQTGHMLSHTCMQILLHI